MSTVTENYNLIKPEAEDFYDIADWNGNMDAIDGQMAAQERAAAEISGKIGTPAGEGNTVFSLLEGFGGERGCIKSVQHVTYQANGYVSEGSIPIRTIDPQKSFAIFERLRDTTSSGCVGIGYTLKANAVDFTITSITNQYVWLGFWVVEFY